jgi:hypothetical protein
MPVRHRDRLGETRQTMASEMRHEHKGSRRSESRPTTKTRAELELQMSLGEMVEDTEPEIAEGLIRRRDRAGQLSSESSLKASSELPRQISGLSQPHIAEKADKSQVDCWCTEMGSVIHRKKYDFSMPSTKWGQSPPDTIIMYRFASSTEEKRGIAVRLVSLCTNRGRHRCRLSPVTMQVLQRGAAVVPPKPSLHPKVLRKLCRLMAWPRKEQNRLDHP